MYEKFYNLSGPPFLLTPDTRFFFSSSNHKRAITHLVYGLEQREGFIVITGDVGAGKTMLVEQLWLQLNRNAYAISKVVTTQVSGDDLLRLVMDGFGLNIAPGTEKSTLLRRYEVMVRDQRQAGRRCVLVVDEVQNLSFAALEELRMLSNITIDGRASVQTILLGQPQFRPMLASRDAEQLRQRVLASFHLGPLSDTETRLYIEHRMRMVGWTDNPRWEPAAFAAVHRHTGGTPRRVNTLCSRLLQFGALDEADTITADMVNEVATEMSDGLNGGDAVPPMEAATARPLPPANGSGYGHGHGASPPGFPPVGFAPPGLPPSGYPVGNGYSSAGPSNGPSSGRTRPPPAVLNGANDILHRIEVLEETTARQDRVFQRIIRLLAAAVEKRI